MTKLALYFGSLGHGHFLHAPGRYRSSLAPSDLAPTIPWTDIGLYDTGLLTNRGVADHPDGRVHWTGGGRSTEADGWWFAFFWWDRSEDRRGASNSGFYVSGFAASEAAEAFAYACEAWPEVVKRQQFPLVLQSLPGAVTRGAKP